MMADKVMEIAAIADRPYEFDSNSPLLNYISRPPSEIPKPSVKTSAKNEPGKQANKSAGELLAFTSPTTAINLARRTLITTDNLQKSDADIVVDKSQIIKTLLLGTADSGKSTLMKQLVILHGEGFEDDERAAYKKLIYKNIKENAHHLYNALESYGLSSQLGVEVLNVSLTYPRKKSTTCVV
jgi:G-protein alpha subunit